VTVSGGTSCHTNCKKCWSASNANCFQECNTGNIMTESTCSSSTTYVFRNPAIGQTNLEIAFTNFLTVSSTGTVSFFLKLYGLSLPSGTVINYSTNLKLYFDSTDTTGTKFGLSLMRDASTVLANDPTYRTKMGQWMYLHMAYTDQGLAASFPAMINFRINSTSIAITSTNLSGLFINRWSIPKTTYALIAKINVYNKYIINSFGFVMNNFASFPVAVEVNLFPIGSSSTNCNNPTAKMVSSYPNVTDPLCVMDYDVFFNTSSQITTGQFLYFNKTSYSTSSNNNCFANLCSTACSANSGAGNHIDCACEMNNGNTSMIFKNNGMNMCKSN